jgi:GT2 family glycosyltransferase
MGTYWVCTPNFFQQRGLLDEEYGVGNWEDNDLCARNVLSGGLNIIANGCAVYHFGQQTFNRENINYDETLKKGEERFRSKYPHYALSSNS